MEWRLLLVLGLAGVSTVGGHRSKRIVGGNPADQPPLFGEDVEIVEITTPEPSENKPLIFVRKDKRSAVVNGLKEEDGAYRFLGIRYAEPPVGRLRFQRPRIQKLKGEVNATKYGPPCPQPTPDNKGYTGEEDCLYLNIFTPKIPLGDGKAPPNLPVVVWIHGGHFRRGSAAQYDPKPLVKKGTIVVTVQYRLGSLGFLSLGRKELPGNVGLFDISTAMRWIRDYIQYFGGNKKHIVAAGQGSGASCAGMLAFSKLTNLISGVFGMSGSPISPFSVDKEEKQTASEVSAVDGCEVEQGLKFVRCMQKLPLESILKGDNSVQNGRMKSREFPKNLASLNGPAPTEEGAEDTRFLPHFILESPLESIKKGHFPNIPLLTGVTKEETSTGVKGNFLSQVTNKLLSPSFLESDLFNDLLSSNTGLYKNKSVNPQLSSLFSNNNYLDFFTKVLTSGLPDVEKIVKHTTDAFFNLPAFVTSHLWSKRSKVFLYSFEHTPTESKAENFLSGLPLTKPGGTKKEKKGPAHGDDLIYIFNLQSLDGKPLNNSVLNEKDKKVRDHFTTIVAEFAKTGVPKVDNGLQWPPFNKDDGNYMIISEIPKLAKNFRKCQMGLWTGDSNILGSDECSFLGAAVKVVTDTIGSAGSTLLSATSLNKIPVINNLGAQVKPLAETVSNPLGTLLNPLGVVGEGGQRTTQKPGATTRRPGTTTRRPNGGFLGGFGLGLG